MIDLVTTLAEAVVLVPLGALAGYRLARKDPAPTEPVCSGYIPEGFVGCRQDCLAHRSVTCLDGRCTYHCKTMCRCDGDKGHNP